MKAVEENMGRENEMISNNTYTLTMYGNVWMDNGIENLYRMFRSIDSCNVKLFQHSLILEIIDKKRFIKEVVAAIISKRLNLIVIEEDLKTRVKKEIKKDFILIQEEKKVGGRVTLKEDIFKPEKVEEIISLIFNNFGEGTNRCILCGRQYSKGIKKLQQASYPFVTKIASLSGVRSYKDGESLSFREYYDNVCPLCYLVGILEWTDEALIYRTFPGEKSYLFMPYFKNLKDLHDFKKFCVYSRILDNSKRYSNIKVNPNIQDVERTPGEYSTLLCFYEKFIENATDEIIARDWIVLNIPFGAVKNVKLDLLNIDKGILKIIKNLKEGGKLERIYSDSIKKLYFYSQNKNGTDWDITRQIQENLSKYFLLDDFRGFTNNLLPKKGGYVFFSSEVRKGLEELIFEWRWKKMGVDRNRLESIKSVGNIIAKVSKNNVSLLYKMDKVRNIDEFWSVLREISRKLLGLEEKELKMIRPTSLDDLIQLTKEIIEKSKEGWKEIRDLLVVYASMYYSIDKLKISEGGDKK